MLEAFNVPPLSTMPAAPKLLEPESVSVPVLVKPPESTKLSETALLLPETVTPALVKTPPPLNVPEASVTKPTLLLDPTFKVALLFTLIAVPLPSA